MLHAAWFLRPRTPIHTTQHTRLIGTHRSQVVNVVGACQHCKVGPLKSESVSLVIRYV
ncbi:uncharacterized protein DS421_20g679270 [Arachis hypogaea]|nr:uncharacterized protein DS421_20g679270 [Arachis hypogaea]